jgi:hypothetical protein
MLLIEQAVCAGSQTFGEQQAIQWAGDFQLPTETIRRDVCDFRRLGGDLSALVRERTAARGETGFTRSRATATLNRRNPHLAAVLDVADGVEVHLPTVFVPNSLLSTLPPRTATYKKLSCAVDRAFWHSHMEEGAALTLPLAVLREANLTFHVSAASWAPKAGKAQGRPITDASNGRAGYSVLNHKSVKEACVKRWGDITHPTIDDIVRLVLAAERKYPGEVILLWAMDIRGAYTQLRFRPEDVALMAVDLAGDHIMFFLGGIFGWTGMPFAFDPLSRAIRWEMQREAWGFVDIYVDDLLGASPEGKVMDDLRGATHLLDGLFGPRGVATDKTRAGRVGDAIGYTLDLTRRLVTVARKNVLKALYGFMLLEEGVSIPFHSMEQLASWGSRYSHICLYLEPFTHSLFQALNRGRRGATVFIPIILNPCEWRVILLFRAMLALTVLRSRSYARSFDSFAHSDHFPVGCTLMVFDASLTGAGVLVYTRLRGDRWSPVGSISCL